MNKEDIIISLAQRSGLTKVNAETAFDEVIKIVTEALINEEKVQIVGFGSFEVKQRSPRVGRNPSTNTPIDIPAKKVPVFKAGKNLKAVIDVKK